jgi:long-chain fatty acid transport protein
MGASTPAAAGGFGIVTQSGSAVGNAFAGAVSAAEDASTIWYNPAGMINLIDPAMQEPWSFSLATHAIRTSFKFENTGATGAFAPAGSGDGGDGGGWKAIPQGYLSRALSKDLAVGVALNVPFGLKTEYPPDWRGRFAAIRSEAKAFNLNPALAYKINDLLSLAGGVNFQYFETELTNFAGPAGIAALKADDTGWGWNAGAMLNLPDGRTRIGVAYRSRISYELTGRATFTGGGGAFDSDARAALTVPESLSAGAYTSIGRWDFMAGATWTRWSRVDRITVIRTTPSGLGPAGSTISTLDFDWRDTTLVSVGASYAPNADWKLRLGLGFDPRAANDTTRTPRLPDENRLMVTAGARYQLGGRRGSIDLAYAHEFVRDASVDEAVPGVPGRLVGAFHNRSDVVSVQYNRRF